MQLAISFQVYSGRYKNQQTLAARVNMVQNPLEVLHENVLVAVHIQGYKKPPVIGKVISVKDSFTFDIEYLKGSWRKEWKPWKLPNGENWTDNLPTGCILLVDFQLDEENKLTNETYKYLRKTYQDLERNQLGE